MCWQDTRHHAAARRRADPAALRALHLDNFVLYPNEKLRRPRSRARASSPTRFPPSQKGLCLIGPPGIGKTHIAVVGAAAASSSRSSVRGLFYDVRDLLRVIRSTYNPVVRTAEMDILRPVMEAELLVLDDLGAEKPSEWVEETMNLIVNTRYNERRPTIFTTNYEDLPDEADLDSLKVRVGFRLHSRLHEMCEFLEYDGGDYRMLPANGGADDLATLWKTKRRAAGARCPRAAPGPGARADPRAAASRAS